MKLVWNIYQQLKSSFFTLDHTPFLYIRHMYSFFVTGTAIFVTTFSFQASWTDTSQIRPKHPGVQMALVSADLVCVPSIFG